MQFALILTLLGPVKDTSVLYGFKSFDECRKQATDIAADRKAHGDKVKLECVPARENDVTK